MINHPIESSYGKYAYGVGYNTNSKLIIIQVQDRDEMVEIYLKNDCCYQT